jgi:alkylhydroperoxidase family enzyme
MSLLLILILGIVAALASYTGAIRMVVRRGWVSDYDAYTTPRSPAEKLIVILMAAIPLAFVWPFVLVALREPTTERRARHRAEAAEHEAREAKAISDRLKALGIDP